MTIKDEIIAAVIAAKELPEEHVSASGQIAAPAHAAPAAPDHSALWRKAIGQINARVAHAAHAEPPVAIAPAAPVADHASMWKRVVSKVNAAVAPTRH